jgi:hypothetical protein
LRSTSPPASRVYRAGLRSAVSAAGLPYGYTVTMWSSGQVLIHFHGTPNVALVGVFAGGALAGYAVLQAAADRDGPDDDVALGSTGGGWVRGGPIQAVAVGLTLVVVAVAGSLLPPALSWAIGGMATVLGYLGVVGLELALQARGAERG